MPIDSIIIWGEYFEPTLLKEKQYTELFEVMYLVAHTHAMRGDIGLAINKVHLISEKAKLLNYDLGFALASQAIGDTYTYSNMLPEAIATYKQALDLLNNIPHTDLYKKRLLGRLLQVSLTGNNIEETNHYLTLFNHLLSEKDTEDPIYIYRLAFNAYYKLRLGELDEAHKILQQAFAHADQCGTQPLPYLIHISALYHEEVEDYTTALQEYEQLTDILFSESGSIGQNQIMTGYARVLMKTGKAEKANQLYQDVNKVKDSLSINSYTRQGNRLHASYQIDTIEFENQTEKNNLVRMAIIVGGTILILSFLLASYIRRSNRKLAASRKSLEEAKRQAETSTRSKSMFLSNMSHEIRTPLNALSGFSAILTEESIDNETRQQCTEIIQQNSELLLKLINDVIDLSSLEFGKMQFNFEHCDAIVLCRNVVEMVQKIKQTRAEILFDTDLEELILYTDDARLQQVLINLLINATKFTPSGSITLKLSLQSKSMALFTVTDTGCGIPLENQQKIFKRFEKLDEQDKGTGLGLSICQLIIKHIGGDIWIDPEYTEGSRFCFTHPIKK
nr:HAMP domain-containing sensor histidine kinase [Bacteroides sp. 51]